MTNFNAPFALTNTGNVSTTIDVNQISSDRMESLIGTYPGERVMLPDYGVNIPPLLFETEIEANKLSLGTQIQQEVRRWEPTLVLKSVEIQTTQFEPGVARIDVEYTLNNNQQLTQNRTAVILVGGNVIG